MKRLVLTSAISAICLPAFADDSLAQKAGKAVGQFGQSIGAQMQYAIPRNVIENIEPRDKSACMEESGGVINKAYVRCRNGAQMTWRVYPDGRRELIAEKPLPAN